jgi:hypothetical protein
MKQPVLVLNGLYDFTFPEAASQIPFFRPPTNEVFKETLDWLDRYLGPIK